jgi:hypothetical protein
MQVTTLLVQCWANAETSSIMPYHMPVMSDPGLRDYAYVVHLTG